MALSSDLIHGFAASMLAKRYDNATRTPSFHLELWEAFCDKHPLVALAAPRGHGKSTAVTHVCTLASVLFRDRRFVVIVSDTETQASNFLNDIKEELRNNDDLIELFQIKGFKKDTETDIIVECMDGHTFRIMVRGAEQRVRGLKWMQMRPDLIICHEKGTEIFTPETGWIKNTDHPTAKPIKTHDAYEIEFEDGTKEVVSGDHRYWIKDKGWMFPWELRVGQNVEDDFNESTIKLIENAIKSESKPLSWRIRLLIKVKQNVRSGIQIMLMWSLLQKGSGMNSIKKKFVDRLLLLLKPILLGRQVIVPKEEQVS